MNPFQKMLDFLTRCSENHLYYEIGYYREGAISVNVRVPGELWEVEFFADGHLEIEVLRSEGLALEGEEALERLFREFGDEDE